MARILVLDIDGILIQHSKFFNIFDNFSVSLWLGKKPCLKRFFLRIFEIVEKFLISLEFEHVVNKALVNIINEVRRDDHNFKLFIMTDRSQLGARNIRDVLELLHLTRQDFLQVRGCDFLQSDLEELRESKKLAIYKEEKAYFNSQIASIKYDIIRRNGALSESLCTVANVLLSGVVKPHKDVFRNLISIVEKIDIDSEKILVIDNDQNFLKNAYSLGFSVGGASFVKNPEKPPDILVSILGKALKDRH